MIWRLVRNRRLLREPARLKEHLIQTQDERKGAIWGMAGRKFAPALLIALSAAALIGVGLGLGLLERWAEEEG